MKIVAKNWSSFQHYKDRSPPWVRLHRALLDDYEFHCLPVASRALAPMLWLLASEYKDPSAGIVDADPKRLSFRLRMSEQDVALALKPLIDAGFFIADADASGLLAQCLRDAVPETETETETEEKEREKTTDAPADLFPASPATPARRSPVELRTWLDSLPDDEDPIQADDPIIAYAEQAGIRHDWLVLAWQRFKADMIERKTKKRDWRAHYRNAVRGNWYRLWWIRDGQSGLTTVGEQARRAA